MSGAVKRRAGTAPFRELGWAPLPLGSARHTGAGRLPHRGIIHVAAIDGFWRASQRSIAGSSIAACELALERGHRSIAFPVLGSGSGGYPAARALQVMTEAVADHAALLLVRIVRWLPPSPAIISPGCW